jgi:FAD binding domain.
MEIGAATQFMDDAWWMPCWRGPTGDMMLLLLECQNPRQFIVNQAGKRFVSEPAPYTDFVHAQIDGHRTGVGHIPCYMIFDSVTVKKNFMFGQLRAARCPTPCSRRASP